MIRKTRNFFLGVLSLIPVLSLITTIVLFGEWLTEGISIYNLHVDSFIPILIVQALNLVISSIIAVMMSLHAAKHTKMDKQQLVIWVLLLAFFSIISLPLYWVIYIKDDSGESIIIKECVMEEKVKEDDEINDVFAIDEIEDVKGKKKNK